MLSVVVLTKNEEKDIKKCLKSVHRIADEIIVIDDFSKDKTVRTVRELGAKAYQRQLKNDFASQRNFGLEKAKGEWVLFLDADERVTKKLREEIINTIKNKGTLFNGFYFKRKDKFLGKWLKYGETNSVKLLRLGKKGAGSWKRPVHEVWLIKGKIGRFSNSLIHDREITISDFLKRINQYSSLRAKELYNGKVKTNGFFIIAYPVGKFCQNYFFRLGFLDGKAGAVMAIMMSIHSFLVRAKLYLLWKHKGIEEPAIPSLKEIYKKYG